MEIKVKKEKLEEGKLTEILDRPKIVGPIFDFTKQGLEDAFNSLNSKKALRPAIRPSL